MAVALAASYNVNSTSDTFQTLTTASFTPATGELLILKGCTENEGVLLTTPTATAGGITWTKRHESRIASYCTTVVYSGIVTTGGTAMTVSTGTSNGGNTIGNGSFVLERYTGAQLDVTPAVGYLLGTSTTTTMTTFGSGSVLSFLDADWNADTNTATYSSGATQNGIHTVATKYIARYATQTANTAGSQTYGVSAPGGRRNITVGIEIQQSGTANSIIRKFLLGGVGA